MKPKHAGYENGIRNSGAQEVPSLKKTDKSRSKATAVRGNDLRNGK